MRTGALLYFRSIHRGFSSPRHSSSLPCAHSTRLVTVSYMELPGILIVQETTSPGGALEKQHPQTKLPLFAAFSTMTEPRRSTGSGVMLLPGRRQCGLCLFTASVTCFATIRVRPAAASNTVVDGTS